MATAPATAPIRWRTAGVALLIIALLLAALAIVAGQQHQKLPAPFGPARNGLIVYPTGGDIYAVDPLTGNTSALVEGSSGDLDPLVSPDGTRLAFDRLSDGQNNVTTSIMVADVTGAHPLAITTSPLAADGERFEWAPDSRSIYVQTGDHRILMLDATTAAPPRVLATDAELMIQAARPPDGRQILIKRSNGAETTIIALDTATLVETVIARGLDGDLISARWSTDGQRVAYDALTADGSGSRRLWVVKADGTGAHQVTTEPGVSADFKPSWSPDDRYIAFTRFQKLDDGSWDVLPIGLLDVASGVVTDAGPRAREVRARYPTDHDIYAGKSEQLGFDWSPDGRTLLAVPTEASGHPVVVDPFANTWTVITAVFDEQGGASQEWQRTAP